MRSTFFLLCLTLIIGCGSTATETSTEQTEEASAQASQSETADASTDDHSDAAASNESAAAGEDSDDGTDASSEVLIIDVRTQEEWDAGHIANAVHIPHTEIAEKISGVTNDKDANIIVYCAAGRRAGIAKTKLEELGFKHVENGGGLDDMKSRFPLTTPTAESDQ